MAQDQNRAARMFLDGPDGDGFRLADGIKSEHGVESGTFVKDIIRTGTYTHPVHGWTLDVTPDRMDQWVAAFNRMQGNGVDVEVVKDHDLGADSVLGYVTKMFRDGDVLYAAHEMRGKNAIDLAKRVKNVSVLLEREHKDGKGVVYGEAITHSSVVQQPVVPGQEPFVQIAASVGGATERVPRYLLGTRETETMTDETLKALRGLLGAGDDLTADNAMGRVKERLDTVTGEKDKHSAKVTELQGQLTALEAKVKAGGKPEPIAKAASLPADLVEQMAVTGEQQLSLLVETGKITPAVRVKLAASLIGGNTGRNIMAMSVGDGGKKSLLSNIVDALRDNDVVKLGEQTGAQAQMLSRVVPGSPEPDFDEATNKEMIEQAGGADK